jgi:hypothetical protein
MTTPLRQRAGNWLQQHPAWESWVDSHHQLWVRLFELYEQGHTAPEAVIALGLGPDDDAEELKAQLKRQHATIVNQAATITGKNHKIDVLEEQVKAWKQRALSESRRTRFGRRR